MPLLILMIPITIATVLVVIILAIIATFHKDSEKKFTSSQIILAGLHFLALMAVALSVVELGFAGIEKFIPDPLTDNSWRVREASDTARFALAMLIIATPIYGVLMYKGAGFARTAVSWSKRFMATSILLIVGLVTLGSLVTLVYELLSGELSLRVSAEVAYLLVVATGIGAYYQVFVRGSGKKIMLATKIFGVLALVVILDAVLAGFLVTGGPVGARAERFDELRLSDLSTMQWQIDNYFQESGRLPETLLTLHDANRAYALPTDPQTGEPYSYRQVEIKNERLEDGTELQTASFELCASFETELNNEDNSGAYIGVDKQTTLPSYYEGDDSPFWNHPVGVHCFLRTIKKNLDSKQSQPAIEPYYY